MNSKKIKAAVFSALAVAVVLFIGFFVCCTAINIQNPSLWILSAIASFVGLAVYNLVKYAANFSDFVIKNAVKKSGKHKYKAGWIYLIPAGIIVLTVILNILSGTLFNAKEYAGILNVKQTDFKTDIAESVGTDSIALMDTSSAKMLGDREIGSLSNVVSQFNVSDDYSQIDFNGKPVKVSALEYAGFFKWLNNRQNGVCGYVTVDPVSMSATYKESAGLKYVPSAYFFENAERKIWLKYPTAMFGNLHFEIDEQGNPYYIASVYKKSIFLFGGKTVSGCIILNPVTGEMQKYAVADIPKWVDNVFDGNLLCEQYNWHGTLSGGYFNSIIAKKGCKRITEYYSYDNDEYTNDYGYVAKGGDIWIYTGVTSVNGDSSNIGFLLANERTGESHYFNVAGADEISAMNAAEGEVQEKGYMASFPALINVNDNPTYIMVLKDAGGLVKLYAAVNVEQYNLVTTAATQTECLKNYKALLNKNGQSATAEETAETVKIADIKYIVTEGNTYIYLISAEGKIYKAKAADNEELLLVKSGTTLQITSKNGIITSYKAK